MFGKSATAAAAALALLAAPAALAELKVTQIADGVYTLAGPFYTSLAAVGEDGVLVTDPANTPRAEEMKAAIAGITDKPVAWVVLSHEHYDHVGGTGAFPGAKVVCHSACRTVFDLNPMADTPDEVDLEFDDTLELDLGGTTAVLRYFGPADGFGSSVLHLPEQRIAFTADLYEDRSLTTGMWMDDDNYLAILRVLRELKAMELEHAVNAHSHDTSPEIVDSSLAFVEDLYALAGGAIAGAMEAGGPFQVFTSLEKWPHELKLPQYAHWEGYEEHFPVHVRRMVLSIFHGG